MPDPDLQHPPLLCPTRALQKLDRRVCCACSVDLKGASHRKYANALTWRNLLTAPQRPTAWCGEEDEASKPAPNFSDGFGVEMIRHDSVPQVAGSHGLVQGPAQRPCQAHFSPPQESTGHSTRVSTPVRSHQTQSSVCSEGLYCLYPPLLGAPSTSGHLENQMN